MTSAPAGAVPSPPGPSHTEPEVDLPTFAAVQAAVADGFAEDEVLAHHRVAPAAWSRSRAAWTQRLVEDGQGGPSFAAYKTALHRREDELTREVAPIDRDLDAWLGFLAAMAVEEPASLLGRTGLRLPDLSRLSRGWASRFQADPELERQAADKRAAGPEPRVPELRVGVSRLAAEGASGPLVATLSGGAATELSSFEEVTVAEYVAIVARLERPENLLRSVLRTKNVEERLWIRERARIEAAMAADPVFRREIAVLLSFERSRLDVARSSERSPSVPPPPRDPPQVVRRASAPPPPAASPTASPADTSGLALAPPLRPPSMPPPRLDATQAIPAAYALGAERADEGGIVDESTSMADEATAFELPFAVQGAALPFTGTDGEPPASTRPSRPPPPSARPLPIALEDHARLHVELNAGYDEAEVHRRYGVDPAMRAALDAQVDELKRRDPVSAAAWLDVYQAHAAWLLAVDGADA